jgi:hypothetical protein
MNGLVIAPCCHAGLVMPFQLLSRLSLSRDDTTTMSAERYPLLIPDHSN